MIKYASNAFLATKITFINEIANLCEKTNGSCFPKDTKAIITTADKFKTNLSVVKSVIKSNENRSKILLDRINRILNRKIKNKIITFLGVTFKANTDDMMVIKLNL